jgi:hypothetical protein
METLGGGLRLHGHGFGTDHLCYYHLEATVLLQIKYVTKKGQKYISQQ